MAKAPEWLDDDIREFYPAVNGDIRAIQRAIAAKRGVEPKYMTVSNHMDALGLARPRAKAQKTKPEELMSIDIAPIEVLPGQISMEDTNTPGAVHYDAVNEFDALPVGYAQVIQPMREYTEAEDFALKRSVELYGFIGAIVRDQYGRILDGNQRARVARWFGKGCPFTTTHVRDDDHARDIARALNAIRRHYPREQRETLARELRNQGFSYREIASALDVSVNTIQRDVAGVLKSTPEFEVTEPPVLSNTPEDMNTDLPVLKSTPELSVTPAPPTPEKRTRGRDQKSYPAQRPTAQKAPKPSAGDEGPTAQRWYSRLLREFSQMDRMIEQFQSEGGVSVLGRQLSQGMRDSLLGDLRGKAKMLREMADYLETITREPSDTSEMFGSVEMPSMSPTTDIYHSPEEA
jgi:transposase-like protein